MLFTKPRNQLTADDIRRFCEKFDEGIRVEYKRELNEDVKAKLPKIVSSFANTRGGVLVIGVKTDQNGRALPQMDGFLRPKREDIRLTIENICYTGIDPIVVPLVTVVESNEPENVFVLVEVDESPQAPHAIENSTAVYVRSGAASRKELISLESLELLLKRRDGILRHRENFRNDAVRMQGQITPSSSLPKFRLTLGPRLPHSHLSDRDTLEGLLSNFTYGTRYSHCVTRRMPHGAVWFLNIPAYAHKKEFGYVDTYGHAFYQCVLDVRDGVCYLSEVAANTAYLLNRLQRCYAHLGYRGVLAVEAELSDLDPGLNYRWHVGTDTFGFASYGETLTAKTFVAAEELADSVAEVVAKLIQELLWPLSPSRRMTREQWREIAQELFNAEKRDFH